MYFFFLEIYVTYVCVWYRVYGIYIWWYLYFIPVVRNTPVIGTRYRYSNWYVSGTPPVEC